MIQASTLGFLKSLKQHNNKAWFEENRKQYESAKGDVESLVVAVLKALSKYDKGYAEMLPKQCMFRINRDVRFSSDKSPYKTNMGVYFNPGGKKAHNPGLYLHIEPGQCFAAAGVWMPEAPYLAKIRQEIDYNFEELKKILKSTAFKKHFPQALSENERLQRPPKGYDEANPAIELIKQKSFVVSAPVSDAEIIDKHFLKKLIPVFEAAMPFNRFLQQAFD